MNRGNLLKGSRLNCDILAGFDAQNHSNKVHPLILFCLGVELRRWEGQTSEGWRYKSTETDKDTGNIWMLSDMPLYFQQVRPR
jgi:hypothetical protein